MEKVLIIGASGHAKVIIEAIELNKNYQIFGFVDSYKQKGDKILGYEILGKEEVIPDLLNKGISKGIIAIGDNWIRYLMYEKIKKISPNFDFITVIHPSAIVSPYSKIGKGTVILASGTLNTDTIVGDFCIINTNANFGHDGVMKDFSSLAPGVTTGGMVTIGEFTAVSLGVSIIQNISIGEHSIIGAGAVLTNNIEDYKVAYGVPAKVIRERKKGESYLNSVVLDTNFKTYKIKNKEGLESYKEMLEKLHNSNPFYKIVLLDTKDMTKHQLYYFVLEKNETPIVIMPFYVRKIYIGDEETSHIDVTSPSGYCGPLFDAKVVNEDIMKHFWRQVDLWYRKKKVVTEFVSFNLMNNQLQYSGELIPSLKNVKGVLIDKEEQWSNFTSKVKNNYEKAIQQELKLKIYSNPIAVEVIKDFYDIYMQTIQLNKTQSQYFHFIDYFKNFILENPESVILVMVYKDSRPISTELILLDSDTLYSYLGGTVSDYFSVRPNDFLKIEVMNWARDKGYKYYVLGGGREDNDSLYKYKKSFFPNDKDVIYYTGRKVVNPEVYKELVYNGCEEEQIHELEDITKNYFPLYRYNN